MQPPHAAPVRLRVSVGAQTLQLLETASGTVLRTYPVSTSRYGLGSEPGSNRTPLGQFRIAEKIGAGQPLGTVFRARKPCPEINPSVALRSQEADLILSRILWLEGCEAHNLNTRARFIYLHGTNHESHLGRPASHGCVRMGNLDVVELFELVPAGAELTIEET